MNQYRRYNYFGKERIYVIVPKKIQLWNIRNKAVIKTWVMNPEYGTTSYRGTSFWKKGTYYKGFLIKRP